MYPTDDVDLDGLIRHTDMAMYRSKSLGRGTYSFFSDDLNAAVTARLSLEGSLRRAIERKRVPAATSSPRPTCARGSITGVEALMRWHCPGQRHGAADRFIAVLEDTGMILPVGRLGHSRRLRSSSPSWDRMGLPPMRMAVNLSARQFRHLYLASMVEDSLRENEHRPAAARDRAHRVAADGRQRDQPRHAGRASAAWACGWPSTTSAPGIRR